MNPMTKLSLARRLAPPSGPRTRDSITTQDASSTSGERPAREPRCWEIGETFAGRYRLEALIGAGGMGRVYRAHDASADRVVALKMIPFDPSDGRVVVARFRREVEVALQLQGPHFVRIFDHGIELDCGFIAMELLEGETLHRRLARFRRFGVARTASLLRGVAQGLEIAHGLCIVHRDLKPGNIFYAKTEGALEIRILDFGIAKSLWAKAGLTKPGSVLGSPHYVSPEQALGRDVDHRTDLWALAVVLYRCLTGSRPFDGPLPRLVGGIVREPHPPPTRVAPELPAAADAFFERALAKNAADRFQTAGEMVEAFEEVLDACDPGARVHDSSEAGGEGREVAEPTVVAEAGYDDLASELDGASDSDHPTPRLSLEELAERLSKDDARAQRRRRALAPAPAPEPPRTYGWGAFALAVAAGLVIGRVVLMFL